MPLRRRLLALVDAERRLAGGDDGAPRLAALREANARELELIIDDDGWPTLEEAGEDGTEAALWIALHAINRPAFQRRCLTMMKTAASRGELPPGQVERLENQLHRPAHG